jgi:hypothetical protein
MLFPIMYFSCSPPPELYLFTTRRRQWWYLARPRRPEPKFLLPKSLHSAQHIKHKCQPRPRESRTQRKFLS